MGQGLQRFLHIAPLVPGGNASNNCLIQVFKSKATHVFHNIQTSTPDAGIAVIADALGEALG